MLKDKTIGWVGMGILVAVLAINAAVQLTGCTVTPKTVKNDQASFDGNVQNSGLIAIDQAGNRVITPHAKDRYDELMAAYGKRFKPAVGRGEGVMPTGTNTFLIDGQHWFYFLTANRWRKAGL